MQYCHQVKGKMADFQLRNVGTSEVAGPGARATATEATASRASRSHSASPYCRLPLRSPTCCAARMYLRTVGLVYPRLRAIRLTPSPASHWTSISKELLSQLAKGLEPQGFRRREQSFVARMPGGSHIFHVSLINHTQDFNVTADVAVRHDALQDLVHESNSLLSKKEKQQTASVGAELGNIAEGRQKRWIVAGPEDAEEVCSSILST